MPNDNPKPKPAAASAADAPNPKPHTNMKQALLLVALIVAALGPASVLAEDKIAHCLQKTLVPGTTYYFPDGRAASDSAWTSIGNWGNQASYISLYALMDSTLGYDSPCSLRVEAYYGMEDFYGLDSDTMRLDTTAFLGYPSTTVVYNLPFAVVPEDSAVLISAGVYLHDELRWRVTVTDSCTLSLIEKRGIIGR